ncbi:MAG: hypothetical protein FWG92_05965 [Leptospirales bacterium]|nr:hypothetical protein [Leptospirales bacterium]
MKFFKTTATLLFVLSTAVQAFAWTVTVTPPKVSANQTDIDTAAALLGPQIAAGLSHINDKPGKFARANANSASFANHVATQRGYTDYEWFAFTLGAMAGTQFPSSSYDDIKGLDETIQNDGDAEIGVSAQFAVQLGLRAKFISDDLYLGVKLGSFKFDLDPNDSNAFKYNTFMIGLTGNYMLLNKTSIGAGVFRWRGLNFGTGLIYQSTDLSYMMRVSGLSVNQTQGSVTMEVDEPNLKYKMDTKIITIPLELTTALRLLYVANFTIGFGADIVMGRTDVSFGMDGDIQVTGAGNVDEPGRFSVKGGTKRAPTFMKPKFMCGLGVGIGDAVIIDVPLTIYTGNGFHIGVTLGTVW